MPRVEIKGGKVVSIGKDGVETVIGSVEPIKPVRAPATRVVFENLSEGEQLEAAFFHQDKELIDGIISARRGRSPKHRDNTRLIGKP